MRRHCHNGTCTISHHDIICNINRNLHAVDRIDCFQSLNSYTGFVLYELSSLKLCLLGALAAVRGDFVHVGNFVGVLVDNRMLRSDYHEGHTEKGVRSGRINL